MNQLNPAYGQPVRSLQTFLRVIAQYYNQIPLIIPDGIFGPQTRNAVIGFQTAFSLPVTGEVDNEVWDKIILVHDTISASTREPNLARIFSNAQSAIYPNDKNSRLFTIQGMLLEITQQFSNLGHLQVTGVHDSASVSVVKSVQTVSGLEPDGILDRFAWDKIVRIYEAFVSNNRVDQATQQACRQSC